MTSSDAAAALERIARELDLVVYRLERTADDSTDPEHSRLRRELDALREQIEDIARALV